MAYYKKYINYFLNKSFKKIRWGYVVFFVTNQCNAKCRHCFYWQELNSGNELNFREIEKISKKLGKTQVLLLSGGEPFLRADLFEIILLFIKHNGTKVVSIPTNGILTKKIVQVTTKLAKTYPQIIFSINPSIDALYKKNDELRGVAGSFDQAVKTIKELEKVRKNYRNVEIVVNTTISNYNYKDVDKLIDFFKQFNITYHNFELLRGNPKEKSVLLPSLEEIKKIHLKAIKARNYYIKKNSGLLEKIIVLGVVKYTQYLKEKFLDTKKPWIKCSAGKNIVVLEPNGDVRLCELHPAIGNLREYNYNIEKILKNKKANEQFNIIKKCGCTHVCFINMSIANSKKSLFKIPYYFLQWRK